MIEDEVVLNLLREIGSMLGFASNEIAWASIGCIVAALLCVCYGLIQWNRGGERLRGRPVKNGKRPRRRP